MKTRGLWTLALSLLLVAPASAQLTFERVDLTGVADRALYRVAYGDGVFVAVGGQATDAFGGESVVLRSTDGRAWTATTIPTVSALTDVDYADGQFIAAGPRRFGEDPEKRDPALARRRDLDRGVDASRDGRDVADQALCAMRQIVSA